MLALYILSLGISAGLTGVFIRQVLAEMGFVAGFQAGVLLAGSVACAYAALQLLFMALLRLLQPTRAPGPYMAEMASHFSALVLVPFLLDVSIPWPHPSFERIEPLVYLGTFAGLHLFFKLASFFASLRGQPGHRWGIIGWLAGAALLVWAAQAGMARWLVESEEARPHPPDDVGRYRIGDEYALARPMPEGAHLECELTSYEGQTLTLRWAPAPGLEQSQGGERRIYVTVTLEGDETKDYSTSLQLGPTGWSEMRVPSYFIPPGVRRCTVRWAQSREPGWQRLLGLHPIAGARLDADGGAPASLGQVLLSGPYEHQVRPQAKGLSFLVIVVEGLGANHVSSMGYERETTPSLDRLGYSALAFPNTFTPAPETEAACMTLLTGLNPLQHGYLGTQSGPLPEGAETITELLREGHYVTAAFTEGEGPGRHDMVFGSGFERGFEVFDPSYADDSDAAGMHAAGMHAAESGENAPLLPRGSRVTLEKARAWVARHRDLKSFTFLRLRELGDLRWRERYGTGFQEDGETPTSMDVYDSAIAYVDGQIGALIKYVRDHETRKNTCIIITSPYGLDFSQGRSGQPRAGLTEPSLRVPLIVSVPGLDKRKRPGLVGLEDVAATMAKIAGVRFTEPIEGRNFLQGPNGNHPISMFGDPLALSIRTPKWRYSWQSGTPPFGSVANPRSVSIGLYEVARAGLWWRHDRAEGYSGTAQKYRQELSSYFQSRRGKRSL